MEGDKNVLELEMLSGRVCKYNRKGLNHTLEKIKLCAFSGNVIVKAYKEIGGIVYQYKAAHLTQARS